MSRSWEAACGGATVKRMDEARRARLIEEEERRARRMRFLVDLTTSTLYQDSRMSLEEARQLVRQTRMAVLRLFPGKEGTFDLLLLPRFERILYERWGEGMDGMVH